MECDKNLFLLLKMEIKITIKNITKQNCNDNLELPVNVEYIPSDLILLETGLPTSFDYPFSILKTILHHS